jgi:hypothetical protein
MLALAALPLLTACDGPQSVLDAHGPSAVHLKQLIVAIVGVCSPKLLRESLRPSGG